MKIKTFWFLYFSALSILFSQSNSKNIDILGMSELIDNKNDSLNLPDIKSYQIIDIKNDTIYLDTTLTIKKHHRFNYLRKDNFNLLKFSNIGQTYNELTYSNDDLTIYPKMNFDSKKHAYINSSEIYYYQVPTPLTELLFKTVMKQGQHTDAFFTSNLSEKLNFSLAFKGLRSLGNYQNILSGSKQFRFTTKYNSSNDKYNLRFHYVTQSFENKENGGLDDESIINFESDDPLFNERSKLSVKFENATNNFTSKRYFINQEFLLNNKKSNNSISIGHNFEYETLKNIFEQSNASEFYGDLIEGAGNVNDRTNIKTSKNEFYTFLNSNLLGKIKVIYTNYNYNYSVNVMSETNKKINENENAVSFKLNKNLFGHKFEFDFAKNLFGDRLGDFIAVNTSSEKKLKYDIGFSIIRKHPGLYYELYQSNYSSLNWQTDIKKKLTTNLFFKINLESFGNIGFDIKKITNYTFFSLENQNNLIPKVNQIETELDYFYGSWEKEFKFGRFGLDNKLVYQNVNQSGDFLNLPNFITRNTFYYSNKILKGALFFQTGFSVKYFSKFYANEYNPAISSFHVQKNKKIGKFPLIDFFANAKIKQTRVFLKVEHFNSSFTGNDFYSSPTYPYRDFIVRFGLVWNFFN